MVASLDATLPEIIPAYPGPLSRLSEVARDDLESEAVAEALQVVTSLSSPRGFPQTVVEKARRLTRADSAAFLRFDVENGVQHLEFAGGGQKVNGRDLRKGYEEALTAFVSRQPETTVVHNYLDDPRFSHIPNDLVKHEGIRSIVATPVVAGSQLLGILAVHKRQPAGFTWGDIRTLSLLARAAAVGLENHRLYSEECARSEELRRLNALLRKEQEAAWKALTIHDRFAEMVLQNRGIKAIARTLAGLVGNPVMVQDQSLRLVAVASWGNRRLEHLWDAGTGPDWSSLENRGCLLHRAKRPIRIDRLPSSGIEEPVVVAPIAGDEDNLGYVCVLETERPLERLDFVALEHAANVIALELMKQRIAEEVESRITGDFVNGLLSADCPDEATLMSRASLLGYDLTQPRRVFTCDCGIEGATQAMASETQAVAPLAGVAREVAMGMPAGTLVRARGGGLLVVAPREKAAPSPEEAVELARVVRQGISRSHPSASVSIGIGAPCSGVDGFRRSYRQALLCLATLRETGEPDQTQCFEQLGFARVFLSDTPRSDLLDTANHLLGPLRDYDQNHGTELYKTLATFLLRGGNLRETARSLFVHISTLNYRLQRIEQIAGVDLHDPECRFNLQLAVKALGVLTASPDS